MEPELHRAASPDLGEPAITVVHSGGKTLYQVADGLAHEFPEQAAEEAVSTGRKEMLRRQRLVDELLGSTGETRTASQGQEPGELGQSN